MGGGGGGGRGPFALFLGGLTPLKFGKLWTDVMASLLQDLGEDPTIDPAVLLLAHIKEIVQIIQAILVLMASLKFF